MNRLQASIKRLVRRTLLVVEARGVHARFFYGIRAKKPNPPYSDTDAEQGMVALSSYFSPPSAQTAFHSFSLTG